VAKKARSDGQEKENNMKLHFSGLILAIFLAVGG
jgi:hypothetical protein